VARWVALTFPNSRRLFVAYQFDLNTPPDLEIATPYSLIGFNSSNFSPDQFSLQLLNPLLTAQARFLVTGAGGPGEVQIIIDSIQATGPLLQNDPLSASHRLRTSLLPGT